MHSDMNPVRGEGHGFHQVENSYKTEDFRGENRADEIFKLRVHASRMKEVMATFKRLKQQNVIPSKAVGVQVPDKNAVKGNVDAKIYHPTRGGTIVQFLAGHDGNKKVLNFCKEAQLIFHDTFGSTSEDKYRQNPDSVSATAMIPIDNLHVTALAAGVIDAKDEDRFLQELENNKAYRACFHFFDENKHIGSLRVGGMDLSRDQLLAKIASHFAPLKFIEEELPQEIKNGILKLMQNENNKKSEKLISFMESGGAVFNAVDLKITSNGSIVLQLAANNDLIQAREGLVELGGIAKGGLGNITAISLGFIPNFDKITDRENYELQEIVSGVNSEMLRRQLTVRMDKLTFVNFKVNTLEPLCIEVMPLNSKTTLRDMKFTYLK